MGENSCWKSEEEYGVRSAINKEDLENIAKLKSLLRALYEKKMPKACPKHNGHICTSETNGWCIYIEEMNSCSKRAEGCQGLTEGNNQRCSCMVGIYGDACQYRMCPGVGKGMYTAFPRGNGACTNRGDCNHRTGVCTCKKDFYHGPKNACDYKHAPPSKNKEVDD